MKIFIPVFLGFLLAGLTVIVVIIVAILANPAIVTNPTELTVRYSVQSYTTNNSHGYAELSYIGKPENSDEEYKSRVADAETIVRQDAVDGKCVLEENYITGSILHVPPDQGVCRTQ